MTGYRNAKNVGHVMIGAGCLSQLGEVLAPRRSIGGPAVWFYDHFFKGRELPGQPAARPEDITVYVDTAAEPTTEGVDACAARVRGELDGRQPCAMLAFGGGSTMDTCKCVANLLANPGRAEDYQGWELVRNPAPYKIGCPTLSGTGAESSRTGVLCNEARNLKLGMNSDYSMFDQLVLDPELLETVPRDQYFFTGIDTYMHCFESLSGSYRNVVVDALAEKALELCREVFGQGDMMSPEHREKLMIASYLGGMAAGFVGVVHPLSAGLSMVLHLRHGFANVCALSVLEDIYPREHAEVMGMMKRQGVTLPGNLCGGCTGEQFEQMYMGSIVHDKPLTNALGPNFREILTPESVIARFRRI
ncbi:MAG: iron-containing alcohol dehydrogenase family protein [Desulfovibrionaceae bacterium]|nr:iron-containing alcohol dehydrogenase family protein [Desulfovibrionaceae bacterium]